MLVIYAEKGSLAKTIAAVLHAGQRIPLKGEPTVFCWQFISRDHLAFSQPVCYNKIR